MVKRCASCNKVIEEEFGKLKGSLIKVKNEKGEKEFVYVCSDCEKDKKWIEKAVVRAA
jgi:hypothetical protein|tara:strand:+ start:1402 stop:1575 length:174 start_codon:yes stop_codon:yes gene_type:complete